MPTIRRACLALLSAATLAASCSSCSSSTTIRTTVHRVQWPVSCRIRIAQLTDLHLGWGAPESLVMKAVQQVKDARPDLTVLTGDYINHLYHLEQLRRVARRLPRPCLATLGNHDHKASAKKITAVLEGEGIAVLSNESRALTLRGNRLVVVGIDDSITRHHDVPKALAGLAPGRGALVLSHAPSIAELVARHSHGGARHLLLVGHTHAGQIYIPLVSPAVARIKGARYLAGWYEVKAGRMYVNAGIGNASIKRRVGRRARPEVALFDLVPRRKSPQMRKPTE